MPAPTGLAFDGNYNLYIADNGNNAIRRVDASTYNVTTVAGTGTPGYSSAIGAATSSQLSGPFGVATRRRVQPSWPSAVGREGGGAVRRQNRPNEWRA
ncbi:MAG: hypothetical protein ABSF98_16530 [Bryobacteraceae bacterium]